MLCACMHVRKNSLKGKERDAERRGLWASFPDEIFYWSKCMFLFIVSFWGYCTCCPYELCVHCMHMSLNTCVHVCLNLMVQVLHDEGFEVNRGIHVIVLNQATVSMCVYMLVVITSRLHMSNFFTHSYWSPFHLIYTKFVKF